ncbi:hypothetical protein [Maridesulfovibrio zosterae]|uniref:hypothetical protein n=1 Tax=Maridesulfovibrio zosterae TaxID=82171 RepID=UPI0004273449|nr:hypothetical protein [Maridesulfovibrio zosterae]
MKIILPLILLACLIYTTIGPAHAGFMPYGRIFKATQDERSYLTQTQDTRLSLKLRKSLSINSPSSLLSVSPYVYLKHAFLVGTVKSDVQRNVLIENVKKMPDFSGLSYYLPIKQDIKGEISNLELKLKGILEPDYPSSKFSLKVVQNTVVLLGVLSFEEQEKVLQTIKKIAPANKIINFLQTIPADNMKRKRIRPLRSLFD